MKPHLHPRLLEWWRDDPSDPDRPLLSNKDVQRLIAEIAPESHATDLGGVMSLNVRLEPVDMVLRVHQPFVSRQRLLAVQRVRSKLAGKGLLVSVALQQHSATVFRCGNRFAELERFIAHKRLEPTLDSYLWLFRTMGTLHHALATLDVTVPRPLFATYAPPGSLRRWLPVTEAAVQEHPEASDIARLLRTLMAQLERQWIPAYQLPQQLIHGDVRLSNVCQTVEGETVYLDFGFLAHRPRIHDLAYSLAFMFLALHGQQALESFAWQNVFRLIMEYESTANSRLTTEERTSLAPSTAAVPLYAAALSGFSNNPVESLRSRASFLRLSEWLLAYPEVMLG